MRPRGTKQQSYFRLVWRQYRRDKLGLLGLVIAVVLGGTVVDVVEVSTTPGSAVTGLFEPNTFSTTRSVL